MQEVPQISRLDWRCSPRDVLLRWPSDLPLMMLHSGRLHSRWARWSIFAQPEVRFQFVNGKSRWIGTPPHALRELEFVNDPLRDLDALFAATAVDRQRNDAALSFVGGWIGYLSYDLGRAIEPRAQTAIGSIDDRDWPLIELAWCPNALVHDGEHNEWWSISRDGSMAVNGLEERESTDQSDEPAIGLVRSCISRDQYLNMVRRAKEYIAAGDIYQANIAQRFTATFAGSTRQLAGTAFEEAQPWYGAYLELPQQNGEWRGMLSLSPELFLQLDAQSRQVISRPIKGTSSSRTHVNQLHQSAKDAAELHMIVDLMRNDLGRVCEFGSVGVPQARIIESHPTVHHGVGEVVGRLREEITAGELIRATFPGGSVTGAPKIRAMQIIDELEPVRRGPYCGAIGYFADDGDISLNIAIRTALLRGEQVRARSDVIRGSIDYSAGAGIVADSNPELEFEETLHKTSVLRQIAGKRAFANAISQATTFNCGQTVQ